MRTWIALMVIGLAALGNAPAQEKKGQGLQLKDLPAPVQKTVQDNLHGGTIKNIGKEKEDGVNQYEIETALNGNSRDFNVDSNGKLLVVEEQTTLEAIPAAARAAILKKVAGGKLVLVETFAKPGQPVLYEAAYTDKSGKHQEMLVNASGEKAKE